MSKIVCEIVEDNRIKLYLEFNKAYKTFHWVDYKIFLDICNKNYELLFHSEIEETKVLAKHIR